MSILLKHLENIIAMDRPTLIVICVLCALAAFFLKEYLATPPMIIFVYPVLVLISVLVQYGLILMEAYPHNKLDQWLMWTILASICGTILGIVLVAGIGSLRENLGSGRKRTAQSDRRPLTN